MAAAMAASRASLAAASFSAAAAGAVSQRVPDSATVSDPRLSEIAPYLPGALQWVLITATVMMQANRVASAAAGAADSGLPVPSMAAAASSVPLPLPSSDSESSESDLPEPASSAAAVAAARARPQRRIFTFSDALDACEERLNSQEAAGY